MKEEINTRGSPAKAIILDGSQADDRGARIAIEAVQKELKRAGIHFSWHILRDIVIAPCTGCLKCWTKTPGECVIDDEQRKIYADMARSDMVILVTPVTFGGYSSELKKCMDRLIPDLLPFFKKYNGETHHPSRYGEGWNLFGVGTMSRYDEEKEGLFKDIVERNSLNMHARLESSFVIYEEWSEVEIENKLVSELRKVIT